MLFERDALTAEVLATTLTGSHGGVVVKGLSEINPIHIAGLVAEKLKLSLHVAVVNYLVDQSKVPESITLALDVESAVKWRSIPELSQKIIVFVQGEVDKLHSLDDFDVLTARNVSDYLLRQAEQELGENKPEKDFWKGMQEKASIFRLPMLEEFVREVYANREGNERAISENMWRLGLLRDDDVLKPNCDPSQRLESNRKLLIEMGQLSETNRRKISTALSQTSGSDQDRLRSAFAAVKEFYLRGNKDVLQRLDFLTVEQLIKAGRALPSNNKKKKEQQDETELVPDRPLKGRELQRAIAEEVVSSEPEALEGLRQYAESLRNSMQGEQQQDEAEETISSEQSFGGRPYRPELPRSELRKFIGYVCDEVHWGGILHTSEMNIEDAVLRATPAEITPYNPEDPRQGDAGQCLFSLLRDFDRLVPEGNSFIQTLNRVITGRNKLVEYIEFLIDQPLHPFVLFRVYPEARQALDNYLDAYEDLLRLFRDYETRLHADDPDATRFVATELLRLDVIHICATTSDDHEWKAMLTPLHPLYLWRFREILRSAQVGDRSLTEDEEKQLASALPDLPHLLHFVVFSSTVTRGEEIVPPLPHAGNVGLLPTYENRTNRYLGNDGIDFLSNLLERWLVEAPYTRFQIRLALVDIPDFSRALKVITEFLESHRDLQNTQLIVDAYFTRGQNPAGRLLQLDYDDKDHDLAELMRSRRLVVHIYSMNSIVQVAESLKKRPVHIAFLFDQSQYQLGHVPRARNIVVSPLVITYEYEYSPRLKRGTISPSSEADTGIFAYFHFLVERAANFPVGQQLRLQYGAETDLEPINRLLEQESSRWLVLADRVLIAYKPEAAVPLGEQRANQREIGVWGRDTGKAVDDLMNLLRRYPLIPNANRVRDLLRQFGHIASGGALALPAPGNSPATREKREKDLLGKMLAAAWYTTLHPDALIASLDSNLARQWLQSRPSLTGERADLIGLYIDSDGTLVVEPLEVKTRAQGAEVQVEIDPSTNKKILSGHAIDQLRAILDILKPIFGEADSQPLFTPARREALKYQVHRECFREIHDSEWRQTWTNNFKRAFPPRSDVSIPVRFRGTVLHIQLEDVCDEIVTKDESDPSTPIALVKLGTAAIQRLINVPPTDPNPPSSPNPPNPSPLTPSSSPDTPSLQETSELSSDKAQAPKAASETGIEDANTNNLKSKSKENNNKLGNARNSKAKQQENSENTPIPASAVVMSNTSDNAESQYALYNIMLGVQGETPQYGLLGEVGGNRVALDLNQTHTISLFGVQGGGKSYTLGSIIEMACLPVQNINVLPKPLATVVFHYSPTQDYKPEFTSMINSNSDANQIRELSEFYNASPASLKDVLILTPKSKVQDRQSEYPDIEVLPIAFSASELKASHWKFLMGAVGSQSMYLRQINLIMRRLRNNLTLDALYDAVEESNLADHLKELARTRLQFAGEYVDDDRRLTDIIRPGRLIIVDLRDEFIEKDEALGLFVVLLQIFAEATYNGQTFNKLVVFDEAHKYIENKDLIEGLIEVVREMRHKGTSILVASQDPPSVPSSLIELSSQIILHKFNSPSWLKHIQKTNASLNELTPEKMSSLSPGEAYIWSSKASDKRFTRGAIKIRCRPRVTQHGGATKTAV